MSLGMLLDATATGIYYGGYAIIKTVQWIFPGKDKEKSAIELLQEQNKTITAQGKQLTDLHNTIRELQVLLKNQNLTESEADRAEDRIFTASTNIIEVGNE